MDIFLPNTRKKLMASIKSKDTAPELIVRRFLFRNGIRFRLHSQKLPGKPDISITSIRVAIFINGCFWHGHKGCRYSKIPMTNTVFWKTKISTNIERDKKAIKELRKLGWEPIIVWSCSLKSAEKSKECLDGLLSMLQTRYLTKKINLKSKTKEAAAKTEERGLKDKNRKKRRPPPKKK